MLGLVGFALFAVLGLLVPVDAVNPLVRGISGAAFGVLLSHLGRWLWFVLFPRPWPIGNLDVTIDKDRSRIQVMGALTEVQVVITLAVVGSKQRYLSIKDAVLEWRSYPWLWHRRTLAIIPLCSVHVKNEVCALPLPSDSMAMTMMFYEQFRPAFNHHPPLNSKLRLRLTLGDVVLRTDLAVVEMGRTWDQGGQLRKLLVPDKVAPLP